MTFNVEATSVWHDEDVIKSYPQLSDFTFRYVEEAKPRFEGIRDEGGRLMLQQVGTKVVKKPKIEIESLEEIIGLLNSVDQPLIIDRGRDGFTIEIYDGYRE